jgi:hypothetical protein
MRSTLTKSLLTRRAYVQETRGFTIECLFKECFRVDSDARTKQRWHLCIRLSCTKAKTLGSCCMLLYDFACEDH